MEQRNSFQLILDLRCNNRCTICGASWPFRPRLNTIQAIERLRRGILLGLTEVVISGGEVTLRSDLMEIIHAAREMGYSSIVLLTNGRRLANPDYLKSLVEAGITAVGVSLHGHTPKIHEQITRTPHSFKEAVTGITTIRSHFPTLPLSVNCVLTGENYRHSANIVRFLIELNVRVIQFTYVIPIGKAKGIYFQAGVPSMSEALLFVRKGIDVFLSAYNGISETSFILAFFPLCVLGDLLQFSGDLTQSSSYLASEAGSLVLIDEKIAMENLKVKRKECEACRFSEVCHGVWQEYIDAKGWEEFEPIREFDPNSAFSSTEPMRHS